MTKIFQQPKPTVIQQSAAPEAMPTPAAPAAPDPVRVPNATDPDVVAARRVKVQEDFANRRGRDSTRLTKGEGRDIAYTRTTLG